MRNLHIIGNKEDPAKVAKEMRTLRDKSGKLCFQVDEWRTAKQISSYFSRLSAAQRHRKASTELKAEDADSIDENDLQAWDNEKRRKELQTAMYDEVDLKHPIFYDGHDICCLSKQGKLKTKFKIGQLKEICEAYGIAIVGTVGRKNSYVAPIEALIKTCGCSEFET